MDWDKHGTTEGQSKSSGKRRIAVPVTPQLEKLMDMFKSKYPGRKFSDAGVLKTFIEAGAKVWYSQQQSERNIDNEQVQETQV